jgi:hypothetical protein
MPSKTAPQKRSREVGDALVALYVVVGVVLTAVWVVALVVLARWVLSAVF